MTSILTQTIDLSSYELATIQSTLSDMPVDTKALIKLKSNEKVFSIVKVGYSTWQDQESKNTSVEDTLSSTLHSGTGLFYSTVVFEKPKPFSIESQADLLDFLHSKGKNSLGYLIGKNDSSGFNLGNYGTQWYLFSGKDTKAILKEASSPTYTKSIDEAIALIDKAKAELTLDRSAKIQSTKMKKRLVDFKYQLSLASKLLAGDTVEGIENYTWGQSSETPSSVWPFTMIYLHQALTEVNVENLFKISVKDLGFDPYDGSTTQYYTYIKSIDLDAYSWVVFLDSDDVKSYALHLMKAPGFQLHASKVTALKKKADSSKLASEAKDALAFSGLSHFTPRDAVKGFSFPVQPTFLSVNQWASVMYVTSSLYANNFPVIDMPMPKSVKDFEYKFAPSWLYNAVFYAFGLSTYNSSYYDTECIMAVDTVNYLLRSGIWYSGPTYKSDHYNSKYFPVKPGMSVYVYNGDSDVYAFVPKFAPEGSTIFGFDHAGRGKWQSYYFVADNFTLKYAASSKVTLEDAGHFDQKFDSEVWDLLEKAEKSIVVPTELTGPEAITVKNRLLIHGESRKVTDFPYKVQALILQNGAFTPIIIFKFDLGHYDPANDEEADWGQFIADHPEFSAIKNISDEDQINLFVKSASNIESALMLSTLGATNYYSDDDVLGAKFSLREALLAWENNNKPQASNLVGMPPVGVTGLLKPIPSLHMGGQQVKTYFADANGDTYMGKPNNADKFRPDSEQAATTIGRMFGFNVPESALRVIDGQYTHVQTILENVTSLQAVKPLTLDDQTLTVAMQGHVLDWLISNHDSSGINLALSSSGGATKLWKIDLGQAWKALGSDQLKAGWELPGNYGGVWYNEFYSAIKKKTIDQVRLDKIVKSVLTKARYVSTYRDEDFRVNLEGAFSERTFYPQGFDKKSFIELAMSRKSSTFTDFFLFYENLYAACGYTFTFDVETFDSTRLEGTDAHLTVSEEFANQVSTNKIFGKSLMVGDSNIEDSHIFFYTIKNGKSTDLRGELKVRNEGDKILDKWINTYLVSGSKTITPKAPNQLGESVLPFTQDAVDVLVAFAKNTNFHYDDNSYNSAHMNAANEQIKFISEGKKNPSLYGMNEHMLNAWLAWADETLANFDLIKAAVSNHSKVPVMPSVQMYTAPKVTVEIKKATPKPKVVDTKKYKVQQGSFTTPKTSATDESGLSSYQSEQSHGGMKSYHITSESYPSISLQYVPHKFSGYGNESGNYSNRGRMQIVVSSWDGSSNVIEDSINFIREMGLTLEEATEESLEKFFWLHLAGILADRKLSSNEKKTLTAIQKSFEDITHIKSEFSKLWSSKIVDEANWKPQFSDFRAHIIEDIEEDDNKPKSGRPYWTRPDFDIKAYAVATGGVLPSRQDGSVSYLINGGYCANEEKIRFTGSWGVKSNSPDADRRRGSGQFAFMRQGQFISSNGFYIEPFVMARTTNYSYKSDTYGDALARKEGSPFSVIEAAKHGSGHHLPGYAKPDSYSSYGANEVMIKYGWSTWDDIAIINTSSDGERKKIIDFYKKIGITEIRGLSLEDRVVSSVDQAKKTMTKIWNMYSK